MLDLVWNIFLRPKMNKKRHKIENEKLLFNLINERNCTEILKVKILWSMCPWGSSQIIKIVLVMLISGVILNEKHPKMYQLRLW